MKLVGILCWYDESPGWLVASIASFVRAGIDHLVAVDGAYELLPDGRPKSGFEQAAAIDEVCRGLGIGLTMYAPARTWAGNEVEKRNFSLSLAELDDPDWIVFVDADEVVLSGDLRAAIEENELDGKLDAGTTALLERFDPQASDALGKLAARTPMYETKRQLRNVFRASPGLRFDDAHFRLRDGERVLWLGGNSGEVLSFWTDVYIEHRSVLRDVARREQQWKYYSERDALEIERQEEVS